MKRFMEISKGIEIIGTGLFVRSEKLLIINDLHIGYEEALQQRGVLVPRFQMKEIIRMLQEMIEKVHPVRILLNGDVKHEFGKVLRREWREVIEVIDFLRGVQIVTDYRFNETLIVHGDEVVGSERLDGVKRIIIGHEHPAITISDKGKREKYKCFLKGKWKSRETKGRERLGKKKVEAEIIAVPSFNPLLEGTDVLKEEVLSPFLERVREFEVYVVSKGEVFAFGKVKDVRK